jgi:hypothetical protein
MRARWRAQWHWVCARFWSELGVAFSWDYALDRGAAHIEVWLALVGERYGLKVVGR